jgi:putative membrane protein insertion efficiency factor
MTKEIPMTNAEATPGAPARSSFAVRILTLAIRAYQLTLSPLQSFLFGANSGCRFTPTCSAYALDAVRGHGAVAGSILAAKRICRCHPWGGCGHDPVPEKNPQPATRNPQYI